MILRNILKFPKLHDSKTSKMYPTAHLELHEYNIKLPYIRYKHIKKTNNEERINSINSSYGAIFPKKSFSPSYNLLGNRIFIYVSTKDAWTNMFLMFNSYSCITEENRILWITWNKYSCCQIRHKKQIILIPSSWEYSDLKINCVQRHFI